VILPNQLIGNRRQRSLSPRDTRQLTGSENEANPDSDNIDRRVRRRMASPASQQGNPMPDNNGQATGQASDSARDESRTENVVAQDENIDNTVADAAENAASQGTAGVPDDSTANGDGDGINHRVNAPGNNVEVPNGNVSTWVPLTCVEGADLDGFVDTDAHRRQRTLYGDHIHDNDGTHLHGNLSEEEDLKWQSWWQELVSYPLTSYSLPKGVGKKFLDLLIREFQKVRVDKTANAERIIVFINVTLQSCSTICKSSDIKRRIEQRLKLWEDGKFQALVDDTMSERLRRRRGFKPLSEEEEARKFHNKMLSGRPRQAVRHLTGRETGGILDPDEIDEKSGKRVLEILQSKHPGLRIPDPSAFETYTKVPDAVPVLVSEEAIAITAKQLTGGAGPGGIDSTDLKNWLLRFGLHSEGLRRELAKWAEWLLNGDPSYASIRALNACRLIGLDKEPGVRPVGIGEVFMRCIGKTVTRLTGMDATMACGNYNLCAGLQSGIEGAVHAVLNRWKKRRRRNKGKRKRKRNKSKWARGPRVEPTSESDISESDDASDSDTSSFESSKKQGKKLRVPNADDDSWGTLETTTDDETEVTLLVDARNAFNELSRFVMLDTVRHQCPQLARYVFHTYRHASVLIVRRQNQPCVKILSREGVTQGDPLSMILYALTLSPLSERIRESTPNVVQPWYADDVALVGTATDVKKAMKVLQRYGPAKGYFPEPEKSILICDPDVKENCESVLDEFKFQFASGSRYLGGFIGDVDSLEKWIQPKIKAWVNAIRKLARVAVKYPQTAYAGFSKSLQMEWQYLQRVVPESTQYFAPLEKAIREDFLPALLGEKGPVSEELRLITTLATKAAGIAIYDPCRTASPNYEASVQITQPLTLSLENNTVLNIPDYQSTAAGERAAAKVSRFHADLKIFEEICENLKDNEDEKRRLKRTKETGIWLSVFPSTLNGTDLSRDEFRDNIRIRLGLAPKGTEIECDGCGKPWSLAHSQICSKGGLVTMRHDDLKEEFMSLCKQAFRPSKVYGEPIINSNRNNAETNARETEDMTELRGDVAVHGFWNINKTTIFDVRVCDLDATSYIKKDPQKAFAQMIKTKTTKYDNACKLRRMDFTPLIFSVDGLLSKPAVEASRRLARILSVKWGRSYSDTCGYVRSRLSISLARSASMLIRAPRQRGTVRAPPTWEDGRGLVLY
jgi:hypothetical protein